MNKTRFIIVLFAVLLLASFTRWLLTSVEEPGRQVTPEERHDPDYYLENFTATIYTGEGTPHYRLDAEYLEHFPDDDTMDLRKPHIEYLLDAQQPWIANANAGTAYENIQTLFLRGDVVIQRRGPTPARQITLNTEELRIDFATRHASTEREVKITGKNSKITATGMQVDLRAGQMTLLSEARGHYVPE